MAILRIEQTLPAKSIGETLFDLFHGGSITLEGRKIYVADPQLPVATKKTDHVLWQFKSPVKVSTPGPDSSIGDIKQYRDRLEFEIAFWASVTVRFV